MTIFTKRTGAIALAIGAASLTAACGGHGPNSYLMPKDAVVAKLTNAEREFEYIGGQKRTIRATSVRGDTIRVSLSSAGSGMRSAQCEAIVEAINDDWTRVTPSCKDEDDAFEETLAQVNEMQVDEFVIAVLYNKPIDESMVLKRTSAVAIDNMDEMQNEARATAREASKRDYGSSTSGWGSNTNSGSSW